MNVSGSGLGLRSANALIKHFKSPERIVEAPCVELATGIPPDVIEDLFSKKSSDRAEQEWRRATELSVKMIDLLDPGYPPLLREIFDPPIIRYIRGKRWDRDLPQVAIVLTRRPTGYGVNWAERLAEDLQGRGIAVTSGLEGPRCGRARRGDTGRRQVCSVWKRFGLGLSQKKIADSPI